MKKIRKALDLITETITEFKELADAGLPEEDVGELIVSGAALVEALTAIPDSPGAAVWLTALFDAVCAEMKIGAREIDYIELDDDESLELLIKAADVIGDLGTALQNSLGSTKYRHKKQAVAMTAEA